MESKEALRRELQARRQALEYDDVRRMSQEIAIKLPQLINWQSELRAHIYTSHSNWHEVSTTEHIEYLRSDCPQTEFHTSRPDKGAALPTDTFDVIVVPLLGFDEANNRLGMGGGWYDRFLARQPRALTIGLAFECQKVPLVPTEPHDQPLDVVVTEAHFYRQ